MIIIIIIINNNNNNNNNIRMFIQDKKHFNKSSLLSTCVLLKIINQTISKSENLKSETEI